MRSWARSSLRLNRSCGLSVGWRRDRDGGFGNRQLLLEPLTAIQRAQLRLVVQAELRIEPLERRQADLDLLQLIGVTQLDFVVAPRLLVELPFHVR